MIAPGALSADPLMMPATTGELRPSFVTARGHCRPFGATPCPGGVNFAVFSRHAQGVHLVLFKEGREEPIGEIPLDPTHNRTGDVWHIFVAGLMPDILYGYRVFGPFAPKSRHRFNPRSIVLDPYALAAQRRPALGGRPTSRTGKSSGRLPRMPWAALVIEEFDWEGDMPPATPLGQTVLYELHVRGYTRHPSSGVEYPGTYLGLCEKIPHLRGGIGVTAVQLMPALEFDEQDQDRTATR